MAERRDDRQDEGLLARWSRRKQAARKGEVEQPATAIEGDETQASDPPVGVPAEREPPDLPDPATLDASSDFKPFLKPGVPVESQRAALRRLWRLDPIYNRLDGLDDYCEDYTDQAKVVKGMRTAYRVGRGFLEQIEKAADAAPQTAEVNSQSSEASASAVTPADPAAPAVQQDPIAGAAEPLQRSPRRRRLPKRV
jgi:hypothetical protein